VADAVDIGSRDRVSPARPRGAPRSCRGAWAGRAAQRVTTRRYDEVPPEQRFRPEDDCPLFSERLEEHLVALSRGEVPARGRFCGNCYTPVARETRECPHCGNNAERDRAPVDQVPDEITQILRAQRRTESTWVNGMAYLGLIIADASYAVPFGILVLRAFMLGLPGDVIAAARVDGATEAQAFYRIVLPMSRSAIITIALFAFLNGWGDFIFALTLLNGNTFEPVTLSIYTYLGEFSQNWGEAMALAVFAVLPAAMLLIAAQRYIAAGLTVGSVKG